MSGWDWLHAGLEVATYAKAQQAQRDLAGMKTAADMEEARRLLIEAMRNFVFDIVRDIQLAEEQLVDFPQQVYIVSRSLDWRLADSGLSEEVFPDFQDKEYVHKTRKKINEIIEKSKVSLTQEQIEKSEKAIQYIIEMPMLQQAIDDKSARESLKNTTEQWRNLSSRQNRKNLFKGLGTAGLVLSLCVGLPLLLVGLSRMGNGDIGSFIGGLIMFAIGGGIPVGSVALFVLGGKLNPEYEPLKEKRGNWQQQLMSEEDRQQVIGIFGDLTSEQYQKIYEERLVFLNPLLGNNFQKYLAPEV